jgi:hypothetical protein
MPEVSVKAKATTLLRRYDHLRRELREIEYELGKAVTVYGIETGRRGLSKDHFRSELEREAMLEQAAERNDWEKANG